MSQGWEVLNRHGSPMPWKAPRTATASGGGGWKVSCCHSKLHPGTYTQSRMACQSVSCLPRPARPFSSSLKNHATPSLDCRTSLSRVCLPAVEVGVMQLSVLPGVRPIPVLP